MTSLNQHQRYQNEMETLYITEMKSIQPYSTRDEYIYAMKEDLAEWFNSMYASSLNANNFIDQLKNGVLICEHANNVMREAAYKSFQFNLYDLQQAGIINIANLNVNTTPTSKAAAAAASTTVNKTNYRSNTPKPNGQSAFAGEYLMYNQEPKMIMIAYDNITNFIKWCRFIVKVKECLMFETEDLTLCKNEKNFILCLLEVARFGSKFGIKVPTIIQLEQEIEAEIEQDKTSQFVKNTPEIYPKNRFIEDKQPNKEYIKSLGQNDDLAEHKMSPSPPPVAKYNDSLELSNLINDEILTSSFSSISNSPSIDKLKSTSSSSPPSPKSSSSRSNSPTKKIEEEETNSDLFNLNNYPSDVSSPVSSLTSLTASISTHELTSKLPIKSSISLIKNISPGSLLIPDKIDTKIKLNKSIENLNENIKTTPTKPQLNDTMTQQVNLHKHVCSIANKCTCEKKFLVDKIGEGKYRIGNTKNIVFIRILKNHIMVRVGGGWDTLENYLDKHDPCRCASDLSISNNNTKRYNEPETTQSNNIILTPVKPSTVANSSNNSGNNASNFSNSSSLSKGIIRVTTINNCSNPTNRLIASPTSTTTTNTTPLFESLVKSKSFVKSSPTSYLTTYEPDSSRAVDFTDAHLIIERDIQGKHQIGKILIPSSSTTTTNQILDDSLNNTSTINNNLINELENDLEEVESKEMNRNHHLYFLNAFKHDENNTTNRKDKSSSSSSPSSTFHFTDTNTRPPPLNSESIYSSSLISFSNSTNKAESMIKNKMKKLINKIPKQYQQQNQQGLRKSASSTANDSFYTNSPMNLRKVDGSPAGLLKFSRTTNYGEPDEFVPNYTQETPVYTETKLPPRILRKYQKERSNTELLVENNNEKSDIDLSLDSPKLDDPLPNGPSSSSQNSETASSSSSSYQSSFIDSKTNDSLDLTPSTKKQQNSISPKILVKSKNKLKKYKKSKTTDLSKNDEDDHQDLMKTSDFEIDSICCTSTTNENSHQESNLLLRLATPSPILKPELDNLNDSLEMLPISENNNNSNKLEEDSLIINDNTSSNVDNTTSITTTTTTTSEVLSSPMPIKTNRAQWDKSRQQIDIMYFNYSKLNTQENKFKKPVKSEAVTPAYSRSTSQTSQITSTTPASTTTNTANPKTTKRVKNFNLAKEKLYEMKKTIDAKVNLDTLNTTTETTKSTTSLTPLKAKPQQPTLTTKPATTTTQTRTTPRKVKKRSGERSLTTGILANENPSMNKAVSNSKLNIGMKTNLCASNSSINSVCTNVSTATTGNSYARIQSNKMRSRTPNHMSSTSLNKMSNKTSASLHNISNYDECSMNTSRNRHDSFSSTASSFFTPTGDYKENKAYELRKKSTLLNKIIIKNQQSDPIYTRSHPISAQLEEQKFDMVNMTFTNALGSYQTSAAARKRLFAKKNEQPTKQAFDPNVSIGSNGSSSTSSSKINPSPVTRQSRPINKPTNNTNTKKAITPRSKSNNDLYYELERTNSEQDLIELLNNCEAPQGDLNQYKIMLSECEKLQFHINKLKSQNKVKKPQQEQVKKSSTQINVQQQTSIQTRRNATKKKNTESVKKRDEVKDVNETNSTTIGSDSNNNANSMTNSMHRRSLSLPSYIAIPLQEQNKNMQ